MRRILPPFWLVITLLVMTALHYFLPIARIVAMPWSWFGVAGIALGIALSGIGAGTFRRAGTPIKPFEPSTALVTHGLYTVTRNPMYLGMSVALIGVAVAFGTLGPWIPVPVFVAIIQTQFIRGEESFLEGIFGDDYREYRKRVRRWL